MNSLSLCLDAMRSFFLSLLLVLLTLSYPLPLSSQNDYTWSDFLNDYCSEDMPEDTYQMLASLHQQPINLNTATRHQLLLLPFLNTAQADSLIAYRERRHLFRSFADLFYLHNINFQTRNYLRLFTCITPPETPRPTLRQWLTRGKHRLDTRLSLPLYQREGQRKGTYLGEPFSHSLRYTYRYAHRLRYGLILDKDLYEPFCRYNNYPYDSYSAYATYSPSHDRWTLTLGDYHIQSGKGLLFGSGMYLIKSSLLNGYDNSAFRIRPHTSYSEYGFYRGLAFQYRHKAFTYSVFAAMTPLDARIENDTLRTIYQTGIHRTADELSHRRSAYEYLGGAALSYTSPTVLVSLSGYHSHYSSPLFPTPRVYNQYYMHGQSFSGLSLSYSIYRKCMQLSGELSTNLSSLAFLQYLSYRPTNRLHLVLQHRHLSPRYALAHGYCQQTHTRCTNEHGAFLGLQWEASSSWIVRSYIDACFRPKLSYRAGAKAKTFLAALSADYAPSSSHQWTLRYRFKSMQQNIPSFSSLMAYSQTHRTRLQYVYAQGPWKIVPQIDAAYVLQPLKTARWGASASLRTHFAPSSRYYLSLFGALFSTPDYTAATYVYMPILSGMRGILSLYHRGAVGAILSRWTIHSHWQIGAHYALLHYFDQPTISSGDQMIRSAWKNDITLNATYKF